MVFGTNGALAVFSMPSDYVANLQNAIRAMHRCNSRYIESVPVTEKSQGKVTWAGVVDVFDLIWHPTAKRAYAWSYRDGAQTRFVAVLEVPPVDSPQSAVRLNIAATERSRSVKNAGVSQIKSQLSPREIFVTLFRKYLRLNIDAGSTP